MTFSTGVGAGAAPERHELRAGLCDPSGVHQLAAYGSEDLLLMREQTEDILKRISL